MRLSRLEPRPDLISGLVDAAMSMLASQALYVSGRQPPLTLQSRFASFRSVAPPVVEDRILGPELGKSAEWFTRQAFAD